VVIWRLWHCYWECNWGTQNTAVCCVSGTAGTKKNHCVNKLWPKRTSLTPGEKNVVNLPLVLPEKMYLPPLRIKLGPMKNFVNVWIKPALDSNIWGISSKMWVTQKSRKVYLQDSRSGNWCKINSSMKTWMRPKEIHGCHLRGFARTTYEITKQQTMRMLCRTCWLRTKL